MTEAKMFSILIIILIVKINLKNWKPFNYFCYITVNASHEKNKDS